MTTLTASKARANLNKLLDRVQKNHKPIQITGKRVKAVLISEEGWKAVQETLFLLSIPGMNESVRRGLATPISALHKKIKL